MSSRPVPCAADRLPRQRPRRPCEQAFQAGGVELGPGLREQRRRAGDDADDGARATDARVAGGAVFGLAGIGGRAGRHPGATRSGFTKPSKASPWDENGATPPAVGLASELGRPIERAPFVRPRAKARARVPTAAGSPTTGIVTPSSRPMPPPGSESP